MRCAEGYGGPVAHWWQQSLLYTGPGLDWRYEGIIAGYLQLWERSGDERWLTKACRAADDLVAGQLPSGHFAASAFEINPATAGTPHEAACDVGLLLVARALRDAGRPGWEGYVTCAARNLRAFYVDQLWDPQTQSISDSPRVSSFVPNKAATACEAFFLLSELSDDDSWGERYALPTLDRILEHQVQDRGPLRGAIAQNSFGGRKTETYFPIYIARCIPALLQGAQWTGNERYAESAQSAMSFIARHAYPDGALPTVVYANGRVNRYPSWIAALGDVLRAADLLRPYGFHAGLGASVERLLVGQDESGGIQTARGFVAQAGGVPSEVSDVRDVLHVSGWCDKAFRYLASHAGPDLPVRTSEAFETECLFRGRALRFVETPAILEILSGTDVWYRWRKGDPWPEIATREFWLR